MIAKSKKNGDKKIARHKHGKKKKKRKKNQKKKRPIESLAEISTIGNMSDIIDCSKYDYSDDAIEDIEHQNMIENIMMNQEKETDKHCARYAICKEICTC